MSPVAGLSLCSGVESLGLLVSEELEKRWPDGTSLIDSICRYSLVPAGKLFRPILLLDSAMAVGGDLACVLPAAAGAEYGHVASLIHDDIIDGDTLRRGRPSVQHRYGISHAIVAGDALIFGLFACLAECRRTGVPDSRVAAAFEAVAHAGLDLCRGQSLEAELTENPRFDTDAYLTVARLKTASFFKGACQSGAILGGAPHEHVTALGIYGESLGIAFQIHDDLLAYTSNTQATGKPDTSDVKNGRLTLPVVLAYQRGSQRERRIVAESLRCHDDPASALTRLLEVLIQTRAITAAADIARGYAERSMRSLGNLPASPSRDRLSCFAEAVINRDR